MRTPAAVSAALLCLGLAAARPASSQVDIINNLANAVNTQLGATTTNWIAFHFKTDGSARNLSEIDLRLTAGGATSVVNLFSDNGTTTKPGSSLAVLTNNGQIGPASNAINTFNFTPASTVTLSASTDYWVVLSANSGITAWSITNNAAKSGVGSIPAQFTDTTVNSGGTWSFQSDASNLHGIIDIKGSAPVSPTPVPAAPVVVLIGAAVFGLGMKKKRSQS